MRYTDYKKTKKKKRKWTVILIIFAVLAVLAAVVFGVFRVKTIEVKGNERYTEAEIREHVQDDPYTWNTLYLYIKYKYMHTEDIPFIDKIDIEMVSPSTVRLEVYEKSIVGCVYYLSKYMYFDRDGIVVDTSAQKEEGIAEVKGLSFSEITMYEQLPVENDSVFKTILELSRLLVKNELVPGSIYISEDSQISLYFDEIEISIGSADYLEEKISQLPQILPNLAGKSGILHMESYTTENTTVTFGN